MFGARQPRCCTKPDQGKDLRVASVGLATSQGRMAYAVVRSGARLVEWGL